MNDTGLRIVINLATQTLQLYRGELKLREYPVSTAKNGPGEEMDSQCTPRGRHIIEEKIGDGSPLNSVFVGRAFTGEIYEPALREQFPDRDWILTRILRLKGTEPGRNLHGQVDSYDRYIYIHGTPDDVVLGVPGSHGCVRLCNPDVIELFDMITEGTVVDILES